MLPTTALKLVCGLHNIQLDMTKHCWAVRCPGSDIVSSLLQKNLDERLSTMLKDCPRRSVLMIDSAKDGEDGGCVPPLEALPADAEFLRAYI